MSQRGCRCWWVQSLDHLTDILRRISPGHLAPIDEQGRLQVNPVWFLSDGQYIYLSVKPETTRYRNLRANQAVAVPVGNLADLGRNVEVRGEVVEFELGRDPEPGQPTGAQVHRERLHRGRDRGAGYKVSIRIDAWTGQG